MRPRLRSFEVAWIDAAFDAIYPHQGDAKEVRSHLPHGIASMHPARFFDGVLATVPLEQSLGLRATLWLIALSPFFCIRRLGTIASITPADRTRVLECLLTSRSYVIRQLSMSFKALATLLYVQSASIRMAMSRPLARGAGGADLIRATRLTARRDVSRNDSAGADDEHAAE